MRYNIAPDFSALFVDFKNLAYSGMEMNLFSLNVISVSTVSDKDAGDYFQNVRLGRLGHYWLTRCECL